MKYFLITLLTLLSANAFAHTSNIICVQKHDKHVNICIQHQIHRYSTHHHYKPSMVMITKNPSNYPNIYVSKHKQFEPSKIDKVLDTTIKIAIIKHLLED
jgi:hypothetical protein